jgi:plasmid stability protein
VGADSRPLPRGRQLPRDVLFVAWVGHGAGTGRRGRQAGQDGEGRQPGLDRDRKVITLQSLTAEGAMASITIRNLDDTLKSRLRVRAAHRRRSMEEEVRHILKDALGEVPTEATNIGEAIQRRFRALGCVNLKLPARSAIRKPPKIGT